MPEGVELKTGQGLLRAGFCLVIWWSHRLISGIKRNEIGVRMMAIKIRTAK